jgi:hypothetical protein
MIILRQAALKQAALMRMPNLRYSKCLIAVFVAVTELKMDYLKSGVKTLLVRFTSLVSLLTSLFANNENTPAP